MFFAAGCDELPSAGVARGDFNATAHLVSMHDLMIDATNGDNGAVRERNRYWQTVQARGDPRCVALREITRRRQRPALGHRDDRIARRIANAQRVSPRARHAFQ